MVSSMAKFFIITWLAIIPINQSRPKATNTVKMTEGSIRQKIVRSVMPKYPKGSIVSGSQGVTVLQVLIDEDGSVEKALILESPDEPIGQECVEAVQKWLFKPTTVKEEPQKVTSKLTFYFVIHNGKGRVENPY